MKKLYIFLVLLGICNIQAQQIDSLYAVTYKTLPNTSTSHTNSLLRIGKLKPTVGLVSNLGIGATNMAGGFYLGGGSINQTNNTFNLVGSSILRSFNLNTGNLIQQTTINNFATTGTTIFDNVRFNNSTASLYGLARVRVNNQLQGMYLAKLNTVTGNLLQISQNSVGNQIALRGAVINPLQMIYYFSDGPKFVGLDLYNGTVFSNPNYVFSNPEYYGFTNIAFNCANNEIYGLIQGKIPGVNPLWPVNFIYYLRLAKINPATGVVTELSNVNLPGQTFSLGAAATIDETNGLYYYNNGQNILGISLTTGLLVSNAPITLQDAGSIYFITNYNNCIGTSPMRPNPMLLNDTDFLLDDAIAIYPNPVEKTLKIKSKLSINAIEVFESNGRMIKNMSNQKEIDVENLASGIYFLKIYVNEKVKNLKFIKN